MLKQEDNLFDLAKSYDEDKEEDPKSLYRVYAHQLDQVFMTGEYEEMETAANAYLGLGEKTTKIMV